MLRWRRARRSLFFGETRMDDIVIQKHLDILDRRVARVEQILPTLATKADVATLATKEELRQAIAPIATKEDVASSRRHMDILYESLRSDIQSIAEHLSDVMSRLDPR